MEIVADRRRPAFSVTRKESASIAMVLAAQHAVTTLYHSLEQLFLCDIMSELQFTRWMDAETIIESLRFSTESCVHIKNQME
jgi:hypothetical protein